MGQAERPNGAFGKSDTEGKAAMEAASELGSERVSKERDRISQSAVVDASTFHLSAVVLTKAEPIPGTPKASRRRHAA